MFVLPLSRTATHRAHSPRFSHSIEHLLDSSLDRYFDAARDGARSAADVRTPALDVSETDANYTLVLDVPGVAREQLKVTVEGRRVAIETIATPDASAVNADAAPVARELYRERTAARYARTVSLPAEVDQAASQAKFENGVLTLTLVKKVPTGATQISVS